MNSLERITTEFIPEEDRIRLSGEQGENEIVVIWLSQRLLSRLIPALVAWLEKQNIDIPRAEAIQGFKQQAAQASLKPQPPVRAKKESLEWLSLSIDIKQTSDNMTLQFKGRDSNQSRLVLRAKPLRQWLNILLKTWQTGGWPLGVWPVWMLESAKEKKSQAAMH